LEARITDRQTRFLQLDRQEESRPVRLLLLVDAFAEVPITPDLPRGPRREPLSHAGSMRRSPAR